MYEVFNLIDVKSIVDEDVKKYLFKIVVVVCFWCLNSLIRLFFFIYVLINIIVYYKMWKWIVLKMFNNLENINEYDLFKIIILLVSFFDKILVCLIKWDICNVYIFFMRYIFNKSIVN